jgi:hypothetical protein
MISGHIAADRKAAQTHFQPTSRVAHRTGMPDFIGFAAQQKAPVDAGALIDGSDGNDGCAKDQYLATTGPPNL